jgi:hypothetical protein
MDHTTLLSECVTLVKEPYGSVRVDHVSYENLDYVSMASNVNVLQVMNEFLTELDKLGSLVDAVVLDGYPSEDRGILIIIFNMEAAAMNDVSLVSLHSLQGSVDTSRQKRVKLTVELDEPGYLVEGKSLCRKPPPKQRSLPSCALM